MPQPPRAEILVHCIVTEILVIPAIKQLSSYRSVKKSTFGGFLLNIFSKFERTGQKAPRVSIITAAGTEVVSRARFSLKGKPRDLDYPACCTGARRCAPKSDCAPIPRKRKKGDTAGLEPPQCSLLRIIYPALPIGPLVRLQHHPKILFMDLVPLTKFFEKNQATGRSRRLLAFPSHAPRLSTAPGPLGHLG